MANIMINKVCNLNCSYCFANTFVNTDRCIDKNNITIENFKKALDFSLKNNENERIGIIGGEPTLHPQFKEIMEIAFNDERVRSITLFSNGINLDKYKNILTHPKVATLINLNSPNDIGERLFNKIINNLDYLMKEMYLKDKISLGINMYKSDFDFDYIINALKRYDCSHVRVAIAVPNDNEKRESAVLDYFTEMKPRVFEFFKACKEIGVVPNYDCNNMPICLLSNEEKEWLSTFTERNQKCNQLLKNPNCKPIVDILPDLTAIRCFGCSLNQTNISEFDNIYDLRNYFKKEVDLYGDLIPMDDLCEKCYYRNTLECNGGCVAFKSTRIAKLKAAIGNIKI